MTPSCVSYAKRHWSTEDINYMSHTKSRPAVGHTQPSIQRMSGAFSMGVKRPRREYDHSPPSCVGFKNAWRYTSTPPICLRGVVFN
jgi:hypothetical protein